MEIEEALRTYVLAQAGVAALISSRYYTDRVPQLDTLPAVVYQKVSDVKMHTHEGLLGVENPIFQLTVYGSTKTSARAVTNQLKTALSDYVGAMSGLVIQRIILLNEMSGIETSSDGTVQVYFDDLELQIYYEK